MIKPHGSDALAPRFVYDTERHHALTKEAESLPSLLVNSAAAANAVMLGAGYFNPLQGYMNKADALSVAATLRTTAGLFWPVPVLNLTADAVAIFRENVKRHPKSWNAHDSLGEGLVALGKKDEATAMYAKALAMASEAQKARIQGILEGLKK